MKKKIIEDLSYFELTLQSYLNESHPDLSDDREFILNRSQMAEQTYDDAFLMGYFPLEALELANKVLFENLQFSKYDTLFNIILDEFSVEIPHVQARNYALRLIPHCEESFAKYDSEEEFNDLYAELVGQVVIYLEEHGVQ